MATKKATKEAMKTQKTQARHTIAEKIDLVLREYKNGTDKKKYEKGLKKASKVLSKVVVVPASQKINGKKSAAKAIATGK